MRIALCLAGQLRSVEKGYEYIYRNLLSRHNVDVFMNFWTPKNQSSYDAALSLYKPVKWSTQDEFPDNYFTRFTRGGMFLWPSRNPYHSFYSVFHSNLLKKDNELTTGVDYDFVVRTRFDFALSIEIPFEQLDKSKIYIPADRMSPEHDVGSDAFCVTSSMMMDKYCSTYLYLNEFYDYGVSMIAEDMLAANLRRHNLIGDNMVYVDMKNPFPPRGMDSMPHSFIRDDLHEWK